MSEIKVIALDSDAVSRLRSQRSDDHGNDAIVKTADQANSYPCRHCLQDAPQGTDLLLVAYGPFAAQGVYSEIGPIFVCDEDCNHNAATDRIPPVVKHRHVGLRVYDRDDMMIYRHNMLVDGKNADETVRTILDDPEVEKVHIRTALNGCFLCEIRRA